MKIFTKIQKVESMKALMQPLAKDIEIMFPHIGSSTHLPYFAVRVNAGFPSPAADYVEKSLDLNEHLIHHKEATFFVRASGDSMINAGIKEGDLLIVDKSLEPKHESIVIAVIYGEFTVKRLIKKNGKIFLQPENDKYQPIEVTEEMDFQVWGIVTNIIHNCVK
jgi:DNA polymerase V